MKNTNYQRICRGCGAAFETSRKDKIYCTPACENFVSGLLTRGKITRADIMNGPILTVPCSMCGRKFSPAGMNRDEYCSPTCRQHRTKPSRMEYYRQYHEARKGSAMNISAEKLQANIEMIVAADAERRAKGEPPPVSYREKLSVRRMFTNEISRKD